MATTIKYAVKKEMKLLGNGLAAFDGSREQAKRYLRDMAGVAVSNSIPEEDAGYEYFDGDGQKKGKNKTRKQCTREELAASREVHQDYLGDDAATAIRLSYEELKGTQPLSLYGPFLPGGVIDLHHKKVPSGQLDKAGAVDMARQLNRQLEPPTIGVSDKRYKLARYSIATVAMDRMLNDKEWASTLGRMTEFVNKNGDVTAPDLAVLRKNIRELINTVKGSSNVIGLTASALSAPRNRDHIGKIDLVIIDEAGMMSIAEFLSITANVDDCEQFLLFGDTNQLSPIKTQAETVGFTRELEQSIMGYLEANHWGSEMLFMNRRGVPGIAKIPSKLFYYDAPCTINNALIRDDLMAFFKQRFPGYTGAIPNLYIDVQVSM